MALDFPRAWELANLAPRDAHHPDCSYAQTGGALLCDVACPVIAEALEYICPAMHGAGGEVHPDVYGPCPGHGRCGACGYLPGASGHRIECGSFPAVVTA